MKGRQARNNTIWSSSADPALLRSGMRSESSSAAPLPLPYFTPTCDHSLQVLSLHAPSAADFLPHPGMPSRSSSAATASTACIFCRCLSQLRHAISAFERCHQTSGPAAVCFFCRSFLNSGMPSGSSSAAAARFFRRCPSPLRHAINAFAFSLCCCVVLHCFEPLCAGSAWRAYTVCYSMLETANGVLCVL